jgi:hypothetical protein
MYKISQNIILVLVTSRIIPIERERTRKWFQIALIVKGEFCEA